MEIIFFLLFWSSYWFIFLFYFKHYVNDIHEVNIKKMLTQHRRDSMPLPPSSQPIPMHTHRDRHTDKRGFTYSSRPWWVFFVCLFNNILLFFHINPDVCFLIIDTFLKELLLRNTSFSVVGLSLGGWLQFELFGYFFHI